MNGKTLKSKVNLPDNVTYGCTNGNIEENHRICGMPQLGLDLSPVWHNFFESDWFKFS